MSRLQATTITPGDLPSGYHSLAPGPPAEQLAALGRALVSSPNWPPELHVAVSDGADPVLVLAGHPDEAASAQLSHMAAELSRTRIRYVDYPAAELLAERLASNLLAGLGSVAGWKFAAVPRGGHVVLGFLSYLLDLDHSQIVEASAPVPSLLLVDDCAISGERIRGWLTDVKAAQVGVATLTASAGLDEIIMSAEPAVAHFFSGEILSDLAPDIYGPDYPRWRERWSSRNDGLWVGRTEYVAFPWNEPDQAVWPRDSDMAMAAWKLIPPERCLKNRTGDGDPVLRFQRGQGPVRQATGIVDIPTADGVIVVDTVNQRCLDLTGSAGAMWAALVEEGTREGAGERMVSSYDVDRPTIDRDLGAFLERLSGDGLLFDGDQPS